VKKFALISTALFVLMGQVPAWAQTPASTPEQFSACARECLGAFASIAPRMYQRAFCESGQPISADLRSCFGHSPPFRACEQLLSVCQANSAPATFAGGTPAPAPAPVVVPAAPAPQPSAPVASPACLQTCNGRSGEELDQCRSCCRNGGQRFLRDDVTGWQNLVSLTGIGRYTLRCVRSVWTGQVATALNGLAQHLNQVQSSVTALNTQVSGMDSRLAQLETSGNLRAFQARPNIDTGAEELLTLRLQRVEAQENFHNCVMRERTATLYELYHGGFRAEIDRNAVEQIDQVCRQRHPFPEQVNNRIAEIERSRRSRLLAANPQPPVTTPPSGGGSPARAVSPPLS
jgi:hypothetical protein